MVSSKKSRRKAPQCRRCGKRIYLPKGWDIGPSVRRHYWRHHPEVMRGEA